MNLHESTLTAPLMRLVARKLHEHPGEVMLFPSLRTILLEAKARFDGREYDVEQLSFEAHKHAIVHQMTQRFVHKHGSLRTPPDPSLIRLHAWRHVFDDAGDDRVARDFSDALYLRLQSWRDDYFSSARWRAYLDALDHPSRWLELGRQAEADGWTVEANACFAAARWLEPSSTLDAIAEMTAHRSPELPARLLCQPDPSYPARPFHERHWQAWNMKEHDRVDLPTLLRWECDRNFSIRTRIYRSLGQLSHPAAIQVLQEGTLDPHPFARAQAVRSLGRCADPTFVDVLGELARRDPDAEVQRTAAKAIQRIVGFWRFYGEWKAIRASSARVLEAAQVLANEGLSAVAFEVLRDHKHGRMGIKFDGPVESPEIDALLESLRADALLREHSEQSRHAQSQRSFEEELIEGTPEPELDPSEARAVAGRLDERGFEARRTLRRLDLGSLAERRARPPVADRIES